jgi:hypothetical protein
VAPWGSDQGNLGYVLASETVPPQVWPFRDPS